ncbi:MAG: Si-specific NAD(P)(+) transhydrogenase, partial [Planctomycetota bacterium]
GKRVVAIERGARIGGGSANTGTIPSKSLREAALYLSGRRLWSFYGRDYRTKDELTLEDLTLSTAQIIRSETAVLESQLRRNDVHLIHGKASFVGPNQIMVESRQGMRVLTAEKILIAVGTRPARPPGLDFDGMKVLDSNQILRLEKLPKSLMVVGAGVIGVEYACIFATLGIRVTLVNDRVDFLEFVDRQIVEVLKYHMQNNHVEFRLGEKVTHLERRGKRVIVKTASNKELVADCLLYSVGRQGNTEALNPEAIGLTPDPRGRLKVDENFQTEVPGVYAAGDVIGFPSLAATSREQGRRAICHAFQICSETSPAQIPYGVYTIPEISMVGKTEQQLTEEAIPYEIGCARYREIARGWIKGDTEGLLKLLFHRDTLEVLGVHIIGEDATELIHIGQAVQGLKGTLSYFANSVFNYPTLAECYKVAALEGLNRIRTVNGDEEDHSADFLPQTAQHEA